MPPGHAGSSERFDFPFAWAANVESTVVKCD